MTLTTSSTTVVSPVVPRGKTLRPLGLDEVTITGGFWADRQRVNGTATLDHIERWLEREGWIRNFDIVASGASTEGRRGREFADSEVYKYLEAVAWELFRTGENAGLDGRFRAVVDRVARAQHADGYLSTAFGHPGQGPRWSDLEWGHELYCIGHLLQAAVARERTAPGADDGLLDVARRAADLVCCEFGPDGRAAICGHPEIELGLVELGRVLAEQRYIDQAALFVDRRGHGTLRDIEFGRSYYQDDVPVRETEALHGHAVRANYLAAGAVDTAVERGDDRLLDALRSQWARTVARRTYITGGQGAHHQDEGFGEDWELPPDRAYSETCAGIASIMFSWRLLLLDGDARYADLVERTLYNVVATSPSAAGDSFFYANTLHQRVPGDVPTGDEISPRAFSSVRAPWFEVSCCPPNVARTLASLAGYVLQLHQYAPSRISTTLPDGTVVAATVETEYPMAGRITVRVDGDAGRPWVLRLRVPGWAAGATVTVSTAEGDEMTDAAPGYATVERAFRTGDTVVLELPMEARFTAPDSRIDAVRGAVAVERGPEVYCLESAVAGVGIEDVAVRTDIAPRFDGRRVEIAVQEVHAVDAEWPYAETGSGHDAGAGGAGDGIRTIGLLPYHQWGEHGPSTMRVWLPVP